jgi:hypothetical protein
LVEFGVLVKMAQESRLTKDFLDISSKYKHWQLRINAFKMMKH